MISEQNIIAVSQRTELGSKRFNFMDTFMETSKNVFIALHLRPVCIKLVNLKCSKCPNDFLIDSAEKRLKKKVTLDYDDDDFTNLYHALFQSQTG